MSPIRTSAEEGEQDVQCENNQRCAYNPLSDCIQVARQAEMKKDNRRPKHSDSQGVSQRIQQA
jgi:hypothetical protein